MSVRKSGPRRSAAAKRKPADQSVAPLQDRLELKLVRLIEAHAVLDFKEAAIPGKAGTKVEVSFGSNPQANKVTGNLRVTVETGPEAASSLKIMVVFQCIFDVNDAPKDVSSLSADESTALTQMVTFIAWPYVRQHVTAVAASMCIPPITLPLFRIKTEPSDDATQS